MKKRNVPISCGILLGFVAAAWIANTTLDYNYMFLRRGDGTPYDILYNLVGGNPVLYPVGVVLLLLLYMACFYAVYYQTARRKQKA